MYRIERVLVSFNGWILNGSPRSCRTNNKNKNLYKQKLDTNSPFYFVSVRRRGNDNNIQSRGFYSATNVWRWWKIRRYACEPERVIFPERFQIHIRKYAFVSPKTVSTHISERMMFWNRFWCHLRHDISIAYSEFAKELF